MRRDGAGGGADAFATGAPSMELSEGRGPVGGATLTGGNGSAGGAVCGVVSITMVSSPLNTAPHFPQRTCPPLARNCLGETKNCVLH
jgi:hypothetical protein